MISRTPTLLALSRGAFRGGARRPSSTKPSGKVQLKARGQPQPLRLRYVYVYTSESRWLDIPEGLLFDTGYVDSNPGADYDPGVPTVLAVPGFLSSHEDLLPILEPLAGRGYRVIGLNLPGIPYTVGAGPGHEDAFNHTTEERTEFIADFMATLKIQTIDLAIGHSAGCFPLLSMCARSNLCRSFALICPGAHKEFRGLQPYWLLKKSADWWDVPLSRPFLRFLFLVMRKMMGFSRNSVDELAAVTRIARGLQLDDVGGFLFRLKHKKFPRCMVYSKNDIRVEATLLAEFADMLGIDFQQFTIYGEAGQCLQQCKTKTFPRGIFFEDGTHHPHKFYPEPIIEMLVDLIQHVHPDC